MFSLYNKFYRIQILNRGVHKLCCVDNSLQHLKQVLNSWGYSGRLVRILLCIAEKIIKGRWKTKTDGAKIADTGFQNTAIHNSPPM